jgi:hypothetical protein
LDAASFCSAGGQPGLAGGSARCGRHDPSAFLLTRSEYSKVNRSFKEKVDGEKFPMRQMKKMCIRQKREQLKAKTRKLLKSNGPWAVTGDLLGGPGKEKLLPPKKYMNRLGKAEEQAKLKNVVPQPAFESERPRLLARLRAWVSDAQQEDEISRLVSEKMKKPDMEAELAKQTPLFPKLRSYEQELEILPMSSLYLFKARMLNKRAKVAARIADNAILEARKHQRLAHYWSDEALKAEGHAMRALQPSASSALPSSAAGAGPAWSQYPLTPEDYERVGNLPSPPGLELPVMPVVATENRGVVRVFSAVLPAELLPSFLQPLPSLVLPEADRQRGMPCRRQGYENFR